MTVRQLSAAYAPATFASLGVVLAIAVTRGVLVGKAPTIVVLAAELAAGGSALALCIRFGPLPAIRRELWMRLTAAGMVGGVGGWRRRVARLVPRPAGARSMIELLPLALALAGGAAISVAVVEALVRRAELGAGLLLGAALLNAILVGHVPSVTLPGGIRVQLHDVAPGTGRRGLAAAADAALRVVPALGAGVRRHAGAVAGPGAMGGDPDGHRQPCCWSSC